MLTDRIEGSGSDWLFPGRKGLPMRVSSLGHMHAKVRLALGLPADFVLYSARHTALTRLGVSGVPGFTLQKIAGHAHITTTARYVQPDTEAVEKAFEIIRESMAPKPQTEIKKISGYSRSSASVERDSKRGHGVRQGGGSSLGVLRVIAGSKSGAQSGHSGQSEGTSDCR